MSLGSTLRAAREAHGITTSELAARTHMLVQIVEGLENEDFRRIPAPIYGRGFIKLYCEAVGLDPKPLQAEFMDLFNMAKEAPEKVNAPARQAKRSAAPPPPVEQVPMPRRPTDVPQQATEVQVPEHQPYTEPIKDEPPKPDCLIPEPSAPEPQPISDLGDLFSISNQQKPQPVPPARQPEPQPPSPAGHAEPAQTPPKRTYEDLFGQAYAHEEESVKPSAAEKFRTTMSNVSSGVFANVHKLPRNTGRIIMVACGAILLIGGMWWGISALYEATTPAENGSASRIQDNEAPADTTAPAPVVEERKRAEKDASPEPPKVSEAKKQQPESIKKDNRQPETPSSEPPATSVKPGDLKSSGFDVPALYID